MEDRAKNLVGGMKDGDKILKNLDRLRTLASSPEGRAMMASLGERGSAEAQRAVDGIKRGDTASMIKLMELLTSSPEGRKVMAEIKKATGI